MEDKNTLPMFTSQVDPTVIPITPNNRQSQRSASLHDLRRSGFTKKHLAEYYENLSYWKRNYPAIFVDLPRGFKLADDVFQLLDIGTTSGITFDDQKFRAGGKSAEQYSAMRVGIEHNGFKFKYPPPIIIFNTKTKEFVCVITGNTRGSILRAAYVPNCPFIVIEIDGTMPEEYYQEEYGNLGGVTNTQDDPFAPLSMRDAIRICMDSIKRYKRTNGEYGTEPTMKAIRAKIDKISGCGVFGDRTREFMAQEVYNNENLINETIMSWTGKYGQAKKKENFLEKCNLSDNKDVKYITASHDSEGKAFKQAIRLLKDNEDHDIQIRIMIHTGTLSGNDLKSDFDKRLKGFVVAWESLMDNAKHYFGVTRVPKSIIIYGAFPAISAYHNLDKPLRFSYKNQSFTQYQDGELVTITSVLDEKKDDSEE